MAPFQLNQNLWGGNKASSPTDFSQTWEPQLKPMHPIQMIQKQLQSLSDSQMSKNTGSREPEKRQENKSLD